jgi:hypothetical protein
MPKQVCFCTFSRITADAVGYLPQLRADNPNSLGALLGRILIK